MPQTPYVDTLIEISVNLNNSLKALKSQREKIIFLPVEDSEPAKRMFDSIAGFNTLAAGIISNQIDNILRLIKAMSMS